MVYCWTFCSFNNFWWSKVIIIKSNIFHFSDILCLMFSSIKKKVSKPFTIRFIFYLKLAVTFNVRQKLSCFQTRWAHFSCQSKKRPPLPSWLHHGYSFLFHESFFLIFNYFKGQGSLVFISATLVFLVFVQDCSATEKLINKLPHYCFTKSQGQPLLPECWGWGWGFSTCQVCVRPWVWSSTWWVGACEGRQNAEVIGVHHHTDFSYCILGVGTLTLIFTLYYFYLCVCTYVRQDCEGVMPEEGIGLRSPRAEAVGLLWIRDTGAGIQT